MNVRKILLVSNEPWGDVWYSKQHYANELSKTDIVYFINPCRSFSLKNLFNFSVKVFEVKKNLFVLSYYNNVPSSNKLLILANLNDFINSLKIKWRLSKDRKSTNWLVYQFDPARFINFLPAAKGTKRVYHVVDPYHSFFGDKIIAKQANLVIGIKDSLVQYYRTLNEHVIHVPHGISDEELKYDELEIKRIKELYQNVILFIGTINNDVDLLLLAKVAKCEVGTLLIIGPNVLTDESRKKEFIHLMHLPSVVYIGPVEAKELKNYVASAKVCIIPYLINKSSLNRTPLKLINYLAQKKPVVSTLKFEDIRLSQNVVYDAPDYSQFIHYLKEAMDGGLEVNDQIIEEIINEIQYPHLIKYIFESIQEC